MNPAFFVVAILLVIGGFFVVAYFYEKKRTEKWQNAAEELGLGFYPEGDSATEGRLSRYQLFNSGRSRKMKNLIQGTTDEVHLAIFDYQYTTGGGKNQHTHKQTVVLVESPQLVIPNFSMRAEGFFDKIGGMLGFQDIDFEEHPKFSQMYVLKGDNETEIREFFNAEIIQFFEAQPAISVESNLGGSLIFYQPGRRRNPEELKDLLTSAYEIYGAMVDRQSGGKSV